MEELTEPGRAGGIALHNYYRSSASYRVRIALELKGLKYDYVPVHLTRGGGQQFERRYRDLNPESLVPTFVKSNEIILTQSIAIIEYLEETHPEPALLPEKPEDRAYVRSIANLIACDIHPLDNLRVLSYLKNVLMVSDNQKNAWYRHWVEVGFEALESHFVKERLSGGRVGTLCFGDKPTLADLCLVPQVFNARRMQIPLDKFPTIVRIADAAGELEAFKRAAPESQPDAE